MVVVGLGMGLSFVPLTLNAVAAVRDHQAGLASGLLNTSQQIGGSLGLAALVSVAAIVTRDHLANHVASLDAVRGTLSSPAGVYGFQAALRGGAIAAGLAFLAALIVLRPSRAVPKELDPGEGRRAQVRTVTTAETHSPGT